MTESFRDVLQSQWVVYRASAFSLMGKRGLLPARLIHRSSGPFRNFILTSFSTCCPPYVVHAFSLASNHRSAGACSGCSRDGQQALVFAQLDPYVEWERLYMCGDTEKNQ